MAPFLDLDEAIADEHMRFRGTYVEYDGAVQPAPAPRFSATPAEISRPPALAGEHTREALVDWGIDEARVEQLVAEGTALEAPRRSG